MADREAILAAIEDALPRHLPERSPIAQTLIDAMRYAAVSGGKRYRPMLTCAACLAFGGRLEDALAPACAVEFIHAYSLVHDDLPAMDDDDLRRGAPSCHAAYGEATAILAGDALQTLAFETLAAADGASMDARLSAIRILAEASGWRGMAGGQCFDLASVGRDLSPSHLQVLHSAKTGALIAAATCIGVLFAGADEAAVTLARAFGERIGLAFQIQDDILDATADTATLGKTTGSDQPAGRSTFATAMSVQEARAKADASVADALTLLEGARLQDSLLAEMGAAAVNRHR